MSLEKIGLLFLINYFNQWSSVKNHVQGAIKEILLAIQSSFDIISQSAGKTVLGNKSEMLSPVIERVQNLLNFAVEKVSPVGVNQAPITGNEVKALKEHIVNSIITAIDDEIINTREIINDKNRLKVEALHTVKQVLLNQIQKQVITPDSKKSSPAKSRVA